MNQDHPTSGYAAWRYSEHLVALNSLQRAISDALREGRYYEADKLCADAMSKLARLHVCIKRLSTPTP